MGSLENNVYLSLFEVGDFFSPFNTNRVDDENLAVPPHIKAEHRLSYVYGMGEVWLLPW